MTLKESNKITYVHFTLSILVILIHSINNNTRFEKFFSVETGIGQYVVPLFFIISGFLFFRNLTTIHDIINKMKKRVYTLLIPYLMWNAVYYILHLILEPETNYSIEILLNAVFNYTYNPIFWFMFQLILLTIISPIIYVVLKKNINIFFIIFLSILVILNIDIPFINEDAIIYFFIGSYLSKLYNLKKFQIIDKQLSLVFLLISIIIYAIHNELYNKMLSTNSYDSAFVLCTIILRIFVAMSIFYILDLFFNYNKTKEYMKNTFLVYATHFLIVRFLVLFTNNILSLYFNKSIFTKIQIIIFLLSPIICITINYYLSKIIFKISPNVYKLFVGNRK